MTEAAVFYEDQAQGLGIEFLDDVQSTIDRLRENPLLGHIVKDDLRRSLLSKFPYSIIYVIEPDDLLVIALAHQRRRPEFWKERIDR